MSPMKRFNMLLEPAQLAALTAIQDRAGINVSEQIRRAIAAYLSEQTTLSKAELRRIQQQNP